MKTITLASITGFISVFFSVIGLHYWLTRKRRRLYDRLQELSTTAVRRAKESFEKEKSSSSALKKIWHDAGSIFVGQAITKRVEKELVRADIPLRGEEYLLLRLLVGAVPGSVIILLSRQVILGVLFYIAGIILPPLFVNMGQQRKAKRFNLQLIDALSIMSNALRAGYSFMQTLELISREMPDPIGKEFGRTFREISLGKPSEEALLNLAQRMLSDDLELVITAVLIQRQVGGNLAEILDSISYTIRERIKIQGEIKTLTAQGRISGLIIGLIPPALIVLMLLLNPDYIEPLLQSRIGWALLAGGAVSELIGVFVINKIISIDI